MRLCSWLSKSTGKESTCNIEYTRDMGSIPGSERSHGGGKWQLSSCNVFLPKKIPKMEEPGGLQSKGLQRVRHVWVTMHTSISKSEIYRAEYHEGKTVCIADYVFYRQKQFYLFPIWLALFISFYCLIAMGKISVQSWIELMEMDIFVLFLTLGRNNSFLNFQYDVSYG